MLKEKLFVNNLKIITEQDGVIEKEFKKKVINLFNEIKMVKKAFLVRATYDDDVNKSFVLLCLKANSEFQKILLNRISEIFSSMFSENQSLDILLINSEKQEIQLEEVAKPFFIGN